MFSALEQALNVVVFFTVILAPPIMLFALHQRIKPQRDYKLLRRRILVYCLLLPFALWIATPFIGAGFDAKQMHTYCTYNKREDCTQIALISFVETWLHSTPFFDANACITGNEEACNYYLSIRMLSYESYEDWGGSLLCMGLFYVIFAVLYCIPSGVFYGVLYLMYLQRPAKSKLKHETDHDL